MSKDGGPAFPVDRLYEPGMSLRAWLAGQALPATIPARLSGSHMEDVALLREWTLRAAKDAVRIADAVLEELARG